MDDVSRFSLGTLNYEIEGAFRETQYVPIFPYFYTPQGFTPRTLNTQAVKFYLGTLKYVIFCCISSNGHL